MVSEIILCVKEVNQKTRSAAYELLVSLAHAMHQEHPPPFVLPGQDVEMGKHLLHVTNSDARTPLVYPQPPTTHAYWNRVSLPSPCVCL